MWEPETILVSNILVMCCQNTHCSLSGTSENGPGDTVFIADGLYAKFSTPTTHNII